MADDLAARAACPRQGPQVVADSVRDLSAVQRCGVIWAALEALPPRGRAYLKTHGANFEHVMVVGLSDVTAIRTRYGDLSQEPQEPWLDRQRMASAWVLTVAIMAREYVGVHQIWVDKRTGVARRVLTGGAQDRHSYSAGGRATGG